MTTTQQPFDFAVFAKELTATIADVLKRGNDELWDLEQVAEYLHCSAIHVRQNIAPLPDFPARIVYPAGSGRKGKIHLWKAKDVKNWLLQYQEKK